MSQEETDLTLQDLQEGGQQLISLPKRTPPAKNEWYDTNSGINLNTFGFPDNFDSGSSFLLPFYIDQNVRSILDVQVTLTFQRYRGFTKPLPHSHEVTIPAHNHSVTIPAHNHQVTIPAHSHQVTIPSHNHTVPGGQHTHSLSIPVSAGARANVISYNPGATNIGFGGSGGDATITGLTTSSVTPPSTTSSSSAQIAPTTTTQSAVTPTTTTQAAVTPTTTTQAATTQTTTTTSGAEFGVFEDTFATDVSVYMDGVDITANLGGPFNPTSGANVFADLDLKPFITEGGLHILEFRTTGRGRVLPLLWVKSIISR